MKYGEKVRKYRLAKGLSQFKLEMSCGFSNGMISRIEKHSINPTKETLVKMGTALGLTHPQMIDLFCLNEIYTH